MRTKHSVGSEPEHLLRKACGRAGDSGARGQWTYELMRRTRAGMIDLWNVSVTIMALQKLLTCKESQRRFLRAIEERIGKLVERDVDGE